MIRRSIIFSIHTLLRNILLFLVVIFTALLFWLKVGIEVDRLAFADYKVERLYIKLDKKLILTAENITLPWNNGESSSFKPDETFDRVKYILTFFETIELKHIRFQDSSMTLFYADDIFYVVSDLYEVAGTIRREQEKYLVDIPLLYLKKEEVRVKGELSYDPALNRLSAKGDFDAYHINGRFEAGKEGEHVTFLLESDLFSDLRTLIESVPLSATVKSWIVDKVQAEKYRLYVLRGAGTFNDAGFKMDFDALKGVMLFEDVKIAYKKGLAPVLAENFILTYRDGGLYFNLKQPTYRGRDLNGSKVAIVDIVGEKPATLLLDLQITSQIDAVVQQILKAYALTIPVTQKGSPAKLDIKISVPLGEGNVTVAVNVALNKGEVSIKGVKLPVIKGEAIYRNGVVTLKDVMLKESWYEGSVNGKITLEIQRADLKFDAGKIAIGGEKEKFLVLKNRVLPLTLDYSKDVVVEIPVLELKIVSNAQKMRIMVKNLKKIKPYLKNIGLQIDGGKLSVSTKDFKRYTFRGVLKRNSCFFYDRGNVCHTRVPCTGKITEHGLYFYAFGKRLYYNASRSRIRLRNLNIDLKKFLASRERDSKGKVKKLVILGKNSRLRYGRYRLLTDSYDIEVKPNGNIKAMGSLDGDIVKFSQKGRWLSVQALRVKDKLLHPLIGFKGLKKGRYSLKQWGNPKKVMRGHIIVEGGILSDFKVYNNTLAFINTLPALATLSSPGFSEKGFRIKEGVVEYRMIGNRVIFDSIYIKGKSATIAGRGEINIATKRIRMNLAIQTAREFGKVIGSIPLLGYIIMGKDKSMTVGLKVSGTLNRPKVKSTAMEDVLSLPLKLLKRTLESPGHIINK